MIVAGLYRRLDGEGDHGVAFAAAVKAKGESPVPISLGCILPTGETGRALFLFAM